MDENQDQLPQEGDIQPIIDLGSSVIHSARGNIYVLTIVGQIEGHQLLPPTSKSTKYEHVLPLLATIEGSGEIDGLLILLNNGGGDCGLGGEPFHRSAPGGVGQKVVHCPLGGHDHPPGAAQRPGDWRAPDLLLF